MHNQVLTLAALFSFSIFSTSLNTLPIDTQQESQIIESPLSLPGLPSVKDIIVKGAYPNNQSGIQVTFPQGWSGTETSQGNNVSLYLHPPTSSSSDILSGGLPSIVLQISQVDSIMPGFNISSKDILDQMILI